MRHLLLITLLLAGCEGCGGETSQATTATPATESSSGSTEAVGGGEGAGGEGAGGVPESVTVSAEADRYGRVTVAVANRGPEVARIAPRLSAGGTTLALRVDCDADPPSCIELAPGAVLYPCECGSCEDVSATARFELASCN